VTGLLGEEKNVFPAGTRVPEKVLGAHAASYPVETETSFLGDKTIEA
jgi:hypothetical protein